MLRLFLAISFQFLTLINAGSVVQTSHKCRTQPGDPTFPNQEQFSQLNSSVDGHLVTVIPSALFCENRSGCTAAEWSDSVFRSNIPGAMLQPNWEQDYNSHPPSVCVRNSSTCGQGFVPVYAVNATSAAHIQAGVRFAQAHNLKVVIKSSGHDFLGRSTAKGSLLLWTRYLETIAFHESFKVGGRNMGSAVTTGSGVGLHVLYQACKAKGKVYVGALAANVAPAGGYVQGAGHSPIAPLFGLAADNTLEFRVVIADGSLVTVNEDSHSDLFWAMRGGGAGSWGVIISATFRTFPAFDVALHQAAITVNSTTELGKLAALHAQHIFDLDEVKASQYLNTLSPTSPSEQFSMSIRTFFPNTSIERATKLLAPFTNATAAKGFPMAFSTISILDVNDAASNETDFGGFNFVMGSRLIPADVFRQNPTAVGDTYKKMFDSNITSASQHIVGGGKVSENANVNNAVHPKWRVAKCQIFIKSVWPDSMPPSEIEGLREKFTDHKVPIIDDLAGPGAASYSNEADVREPHPKTTFFGDYARLSKIKEVYDPQGLFIVGAGVGSEKWNEDGLCRVA